MKNHQEALPMTENLPLITPDEAVSRTVYSAVWPETEALMRHCLEQETEHLLARHREAHTKRQDAMHQAFFEAWKAFSATCVQVDWAALPQAYPTAGSSEAIREIIRSALWNQQDLVVFDGDYEGYEAMALMQGTVLHRVTRETWKETLAHWQAKGTPWGRAGRKAQWWVSQPSALDGNVWEEFEAWLNTADTLADLDVWVDLCYLGVTGQPFTVNLRHPSVAGVVFSLSKVMGAYYRRIGGCFTRDAQPGLWGNGWFKNLDSLYLGTRWLQDPRFQGEAWRQRLRAHQTFAMARALEQHGDTFRRAGITWQPSAVALLMHAPVPAVTPDLSDTPARWWAAAARGARPSGRRLCLTPSFVFGGSHVAP
jgi:hypothetical protein